MLPQNVIVLHTDPVASDHLANKLRTRFRSVRTVRSVQELLALASQVPMELAIVDLSAARTTDIKHFCADCGLSVVCTHRLANEYMWAEVVGVGALDCCFDDDDIGIFQAITKAAAAAAGSAA